MSRHDDYETLEFKGSPVRIVRDFESMLLWLSLTDLCQIIRHPQLGTYNRAKRMCPSYCKKLFKKSELYAILPLDVASLVQHVRRESDKMERICSDLIEWAESLKLEMPPEPTPSELVPVEPGITEQKVLQVFDYKNNSITFRAANGRTYINATQMAKAFHKQPIEWLRLAATGELRDNLLKSGRSVSKNQQVFTTRGKFGATWIEEDLALNFAQWLSADFSSWCMDRIKELIEEGYAIMPRPDDEVVEEEPQNFKVPTTMEEALTLALKQLKENEKLKQEKKANQFKIDFYNQFIENRDWFKTMTIAEELKITANELNRFLRENRVLEGYDTKKKEWIICKGYATLQMDVPYDWPNKYGKTNRYKTWKRWTKAGREYIIELWRAKH